MNRRVLIVGFLVLVALSGCISVGDVTINAGFANNDQAPDENLADQGSDSAGQDNSSDQDSNHGPIKERNHEWRGNVSLSGQIDEIVLDYDSPVSLDGRNQSDVLVAVGSDLVAVNEDEYSGSRARIDLSGRYNTTAKAKIGFMISVESPPEAECTIRFIAEDGSTHTLTHTFGGNDA